MINEVNDIGVNHNYKFKVPFKVKRIFLVPDMCVFSIFN